MRLPENCNDARAPRANALSALRAAGIDSGDGQSVFVPGRIEFLGKHTDYAGGRSLLCAVERGIDFVYAPRPDGLIRIFHPASGARVEFGLHGDLVPTPAHWSNYLMTVARRVARNFPGALRGVDLAFDSNLPPAAGLSSSSALVVGMFLVLSQVNGLDQRAEYRAAIGSKEDLAGYLGSVENGQTFQNRDGILPGDRGVGTMGGSQDHTAILCSAAGEIRQYGFFPVHHEGAATLPEGYRFVIATSGIAAEKTGAAQAAYNRNPLIVHKLLEIWNGATGRDDPCLAAAVRSDAYAADRLRELIKTAPTDSFSPATLASRLDQFMEESERIIPAAAAALRARDLAQLGHLVDESQEWSQRGLNNQLPQTIFLARAARQMGAAAASAFGAGFGGSVWALVRKGEAAGFGEEWMRAYRGAFPVDGKLAGTFVTGAGAGARCDSVGRTV